MATSRSVPRRLINAEIRIGRTKTGRNYRVYVVGQKDSPRATDLLYWIAAGREAHQSDPTIQGFKPQEVGFATSDAAKKEASAIFKSKERFEEFISVAFHPVSVNAMNAPELLPEAIVPWEASQDQP